MGVGVPIKDGRDFSGGGPIAPSTEGRTFEEEAEAFGVHADTRTLSNSGNSRGNRLRK